MTPFQAAYDALNAEQKKAVQATEGPVMVIAGPGTGKTQILALRIANILQKGLAGPDGIVCLTFTNAGVQAMKRRLRSYIGPEAEKVTVKTFHSFAEGIVREFYAALDLKEPPELLDGLGTIVLLDELLESHPWKQLRPRGNKTMYVGAIKSTISLLKRDRHSPAQLKGEIEKELVALRDDPASISTRGESKGQLKKDVLTKMQSLERTKELADFYEKYEALKKERGVCDFNDILEYLVRLVETSEDTAATIRERYLYALIDEHQDSSGVQNEFLAQVWQGQETQNVFVVGDDRQLIYGFGGASLSYFEGFRQTFPEAQCITLVQNYRSTQPILTLADTLLSSSMAHGTLESNSSKSIHAVRLVAAEYERDEIIAAGLEIRKHLAEGIPAEECAILVPKNAQVRNAVDILRGMGIPVSAHDSMQLFDQPESASIMAMLRCVAEPFSSVALCAVIADPLFGIAPLAAQRFLFEHDARTLTIDSLHAAGDEFAALGATIHGLIDASREQPVSVVLQMLADTALIVPATSHEVLVRRIEIVRGFLHLIARYDEHNARMTLEQFIAHTDRLLEYGEKIPVPLLQSHHGVQVMTLHASKGLEYSVVWVAHLTERGLAGKRASSFVLPQPIRASIESQDEQEHKRTLYVAITRAKQFCTLSYPLYGYDGSEQELARCIGELPEGALENIGAHDTEQAILAADPTLYVGKASRTASSDGEDAQGIIADTNALAAYVAEHYAVRKVSVTMLNTFFSCPWEWYFRSFLQLPEPRNESLSFGSVVHQSIESFLKLPEEERAFACDSEDALRTIVADRLDKNKIVTPALRERCAREALEALQQFIAREYQTLAKQYRVEESLQVHDADHPDLSITGKIDLMEYEDDDTGVVFVTDFKTGKTRTASDIQKPGPDGRMSDYLRQLTMYSYLLERRHHDAIRVGHSQLCFLQELDGKSRAYVTSIGSEQIALLKKDLADYDDALAQGTWVAMPCHYKGWGVGDTCPYCKRSEMYKK